MDVLLRKSPFCPELTQILDLEETKTHYGKKFHNGTFIALQMKVFGQKKISNSVHGVKSAKLAISKVALLTPCMEFEIFCGQIPSFEVL